MKHTAIAIAIALSLAAGLARAQAPAPESEHVHAAPPPDHAHDPAQEDAPLPGHAAAHEQAPASHEAHPQQSATSLHDGHSPRTPIPPITDADRAAAFAPLHAHAMGDDAVHTFTLIDRFEWSHADGAGTFAWEGQGWIGTDIDRLRWRTEGERTDGHTESGDVELLYGRMVSPWWDAVVGVRHDFAPGGAQDFVALGVMGLAPQKFEASATLYLGEHGQSAARFEAEYELPLSASWVLQPRLEANAYGKSDAPRGIGSGLNDIEAGLRLRWEIRREFAPYIGVERGWRFGGAARFMRAQGEAADDWRWVAGVRFWL